MCENVGLCCVGTALKSWSRCKCSLASKTTTAAVLPVLRWTDIGTSVHRFGWTKVVDLSGRVALDWCSSARTFAKRSFDWSCLRTRGWIFFFFATPFLVMCFGKDKLCYSWGIFAGFFESLLWDCAWSSAVGLERARLGIGFNWWSEMKKSHFTFQGYG